jgi:hypothetical protein
MLGTEVKMIGIFVTFGQLLDDIFAIYSVIGSLILLIGGFISDDAIGNFGKAARWSFLGLIFGSIGQLSIIYAGTMIERVGIFQIPFGTVNIVLFTSFLMLLLRWWIRQNRYSYL